DGLLQRAHRREDRRRLVAAVRHAVRALRVAALASVFRPVGGLHQLLVRPAVAVGLQVTGALPSEDGVRRDAPRGALQVDLSLQEVEEDRRVVEAPPLPAVPGERLAEQRARLLDTEEV